MKICTKCKKEKELTEFTKLKTSKDGFYSWCKECKKDYDVKYRQTDKIQNLYHSKEYKIKKAKEIINRNNNDLRLVIYTNTKHRAKKMNIPFNIELEDIVIPKYCPILEIELSLTPYGERKGFQMNSASIDKIDPNLGYIKGNIQIISMKANAMKYSATEDELIKFCTNILKQIKNK